MLVIKPGRQHLITLLLMVILSSYSYAVIVDSAYIEESLNASLPVNASWSLSAVDLNTGKKLISAGNAKGKVLSPGSLVKLFVLAAVADMDYKNRITLDTVIATDGVISGSQLAGNLYMKGFGNAVLSENDLRTAVEEIHLRGIRNILGDIIADDTFFDTRTWKSQCTGASYAPPGALGLDLHTVSVTVFSTALKFKTDPQNEAVRIIYSPENPLNIRKIDDLTYEVSGKMRSGDVLRKRFFLADPALYAAGTLKTLLEEKGINHSGTVRKGRMPEEATEIYRIRSKPLSEIMKITNTNSLNVFAENLLLMLGARRYGPPGTVRKGIMALEEFLNSIGLSSRGMTFADGSGLSSDNRISSEYMVAFLKRVSEKRWFKIFYESFPVAGMDGTVRDIGYRNENIRVKTGQLSNAYCMAGYIKSQDGQRIAFSYMVNVAGADMLKETEHTGVSVLRYLYGDPIK